MYAITRRYVRDEQKSILSLPKQAIFDGRVKWGTLPAWKRIQQSSTATNGSIPETAAAANEEVESEEWKEALTPDGKKYYWCDIF